jgi:hypothetical protein
METEFFGIISFENNHFFMIFHSFRIGWKSNRDFLEFSNWESLIYIHHT